MHIPLSANRKICICRRWFLLFSYHMRENVTKDVNTAGKYVKSQKWFIVSCKTLPLRLVLETLFHHSISSSQMHSRYTFADARKKALRVPFEKQIKTLIIERRSGACMQSPCKSLDSDGFGMKKFFHWKHTGNYFQCRFARENDLFPINRSRDFSLIANMFLGFSFAVGKRISQEKIESFLRKI